MNQRSVLRVELPAREGFWSSPFRWLFVDPDVGLVTSQKEDEAAKLFSNLQPGGGCASLEEGDTSPNQGDRPFAFEVSTKINRTFT